jgi:hypothetical protein
MLDRKEETKLISNSTAIGIAANGAIKVYDKLVGIAYSAANVDRLDKLKNIYKDTLDIPAPIFWDLDEKNCPTHHIKNLRWSDYVSQISQEKVNNGHYQYESRLIIDYAETYLTDRGNRWIGGGIPGDLINQFVGEWIDFALNYLPTFSYDEESILKIKKRIAYIEKAQKSEGLFKYGTYKRAKNKFDTMEYINQQLQACLSIASKETLRACAREKFQSCRLEITGLLLASFKTLYFARQTSVATEGCFLSESAKALYTKIKITHTGEILHELITYADMEAFNLRSQKNPSPHNAVYFDNQSRCLPIIWEKTKSDLPPWVKPETCSSYLLQSQEIAESTLRIAKLKILVDKAYYLTGKKGDEWAYGDKQGRLSIEALLFLLTSEMKVLKQRFDSHYQYNNTSRKKYNHDNSVDSENSVNLNFNKVDVQKMDFDRCYASLKSNINIIREQMEKFSEDEPNIINETKQKFYVSLIEYLKAFYPENYSQFQVLEEPIPQENNILPIVESKPIPDGIWSYFRVSQKDNKLILSGKEWDAGYYKWLTAYMDRYQENIKIFEIMESDFKEKNNNSQFITGKKTLIESIQEHIKLIKENLNEDRPTWRFIWGFWFIKTKGWPFNQIENEFIDTFIKEVDLISERFNENLSNHLSIQINPIINNENSREKILVFSRSEAKTLIGNNDHSLFNKKNIDTTHHIEMTGIKLTHSSAMSNTL